MNQQGGFYIWVHIKVTISYRSLFDKALQEKVLLNPGTLYDRSANQFLRLSYSYATLEEIEIGIKKTCTTNEKVRGESNETICNLPNDQWRKIFSCLCRDEARSD